MSSFLWTKHVCIHIWAYINCGNKRLSREKGQLLKLIHAVGEKHVHTRSSIRSISVNYIAQSLPFPISSSDWISHMTALLAYKSQTGKVTWALCSLKLGVSFNILTQSKGQTCMYQVKFQDINNTANIMHVQLTDNWIHKLSSYFSFKGENWIHTCSKE